MLEELLQHFFDMKKTKLCFKERYNIDMKTDTIAAIATGLSSSGVGIIRVSGEDAIKIVDLIYRNKKEQRVLLNFKSNTIHYGFIFDDDKILDEVMVSVLKKPNSFTTEDTVEINCHGGIIVMNRILDLVIKKGARLAEPGEFTKRAFLNGRIDLSEAEAVMDLIASKNDIAYRNSVKQLRGSLYHKIRALRKDILYDIAFIESALDDPEHISLDGYSETLKMKTDQLIKDVNQLLSSAENGKIVSQGINTVIVGKPNAGKSSLLNLLVGEEKAIVTDIAGTTRDILEDDINLHGITLHIIDTAGIRSTDDLIEKIGVEKAKKYSKDADLILYVVDSSVSLDENDYEIIDMIQNKKSIILFNKSDLCSKISVEDIKKYLNENTIVIKTSAKDHTGMEEFEDAVKMLFFKGEIQFNDDIMITNLRHKEALQETLESLIQVKKSLDADMPEDFYSIDLMSAYASLGKIIGEEVADDLVNEIFSKFCMGK